MGGWTRPRAGFAPIASWRSFSTIAKQVISARSGDRDDREVRDGEKIWKVPARWSALYSASHWHSSWEPRLVLRAKESNNQKVWAESNNQNPTNTTIPSHWFSQNQNNQKSRGKSR